MLATQASTLGGPSNATHTMLTLGKSDKTQRGEIGNKEIEGWGSDRGQSERQLMSQDRSYTPHMRESEFFTERRDHTPCGNSCPLVSATLAALDYCDHLHRLKLPLSCVWFTLDGGHTFIVLPLQRMRESL